MTVADEIEKLNNLRMKGAITEEEYRRAKESLFGQDQLMDERSGRTGRDVSSDENIWSMFIHLSQFCGLIFPLAGLIVPIVLWQVMKRDSAFIDKNGRIVANWVITEIILGFVFAILCLIIIGIPLLAVLIILGIVFPVVGGIKANNGEAWPYPLSIKFFPLNEHGPDI